MCVSFKAFKVSYSAGFEVHYVLPSINMSVKMRGRAVFSQSYVFISLCLIAGVTSETASGLKSGCFLSRNEKT